jgi:hypothetical protein
MRFREFVLMEMGHATTNASPQDFWAIHNGKPIHFYDVMGLDPRFELQDIPKPPTLKDNSPKFVGQTDYSLPVVDANGKPAGYLVSRRNPTFPMISGSLEFSKSPIGVVCPDNWADFASIDGKVDDSSAKSVTTYAAPKKKSQPAMR